MKNEVCLKLKKQPSLAVEAEILNPVNVTSKGVQAIEDLPLWCGNRQERVGDYFEVTVNPVNPSSQEENSIEAVPNEVLAPEGRPEDFAKLVLIGDLTRFKRLGQGMTAGEMVIQGGVGFHAGAKMQGGKLFIKGNAGDWLGAQMEGGLIHVEGSAGHFVGAAYRGMNRGMTGGTILIRDHVGQMAGARMRRGLIAIGGDTGDHPGFAMLAGTLIIRGKSGIRVGANMKRGTLILFEQNQLLPTFYYNCTYQAPFWGVLYSHLKREGFVLPESLKEVSFHRYSGDANEGGKGEVLIWSQN